VTCRHCSRSDGVPERAGIVGVVCGGEQARGAARVAELETSQDGGLSSGWVVPVDAREGIAAA
jgi:hypothetical protein